LLATTQGLLSFKMFAFNAELFVVLFETTLFIRLPAFVALVSAKQGKLRFV
jgi:hypothetical protein